MKNKIKWNISYGYVNCVPDWELSVDIDELAGDLVSGCSESEVQDRVWDAAYEDFLETVTLEITNFEELMDLVKKRAKEMKKD